MNQGHYTHVCFQYGNAEFKLQPWNETKTEEFRQALEAWLNSHPKSEETLNQIDLRNFFDLSKCDEVAKKTWLWIVTRACMLPSSQSLIPVKCVEDGKKLRFESISEEGKKAGGRPYLICELSTEPTVREQLFY